MNQKQYLFFATSSNRKTGNIPQTWSSRNTCPPRCSFKKSGCYGDNHGPCFTWNKVDVEGIDIYTLIDRVQRSTYRGQLIRHNIAGDMCIPDTNRLDIDEVKHLCQAYKGRKAYTYTHAELTPEAIACIKDAQQKGFVINVSCESDAEVKFARLHGLNAVLSVPYMDKKKTVRDGIEYRLCRSEEGYKCAECRLCAKKNRKSVICFPAHGARASVARKILMMKQI